MVIGICAELSFFIFNDKKLNKSNYLLILLYFLATMLTSKRMLCVIILLEIGVALKLFDFKGKSVKIILGGAIALVAVFVITITIPQTSNIVDRFMEASEDTSAGGRLMFWNYCIHAIRDKVRFSSISFLKIVLHSFAQNNDLVRIFRSIFFALVDKLRTKS